MSIKSALFEIKEAFVNGNIELSEEVFIQNMEEKYKIAKGTLVYYFNNLAMLNFQKENAYQQNPDSKKTNRKWTKIEINFMFEYIKERQNEGALNITEILEEVAQLLNRGYQSVNYKYYSLVKAKEKKQTEGKIDYHFTTIEETEVPVLSTERDWTTGPTNQMSQLPAGKDDDILDILSGLISNVEKLPGINLHEMLGSLYLLTNMALQNQNVDQQIQSMKSEINQEKETLRQSLQRKEQQLQQEKKRNDDLQAEITKLAREITAFNKLGDAAKIQNLKSYSQRLNYIIDGFGVVLQVASK